VEIEGLASRYEWETEERIEKLQKELEDLRKRFQLNPSNSHKPPSTERFKKIKNSREKTGRKPGGQKGHVGHHHKLEAQVDRVHREEPQRCRSCERDLKEVAPYEVIKKQEIELKDGKMFVTEFQSVIKFCPDCGDMNRASPLGIPKSKITFGSHAKAVAVYLMVHQLIPVERTQEILRDLFKLNISQGSLCNFLRQTSSRLLSWSQRTKSQIINSAIAHFDETGIRCEKRLDWIHVASTSELTLLTLSTNRGQEGSDEAGVLPYFKGIAVHDAFKSYFTYEQCQHALCQAHILRELKYLHEEENQSWAEGLAKLIKMTIHKINQGQLKSVQQVRCGFRKIIKQGFINNGYGQDWRRRQPDGYKWNWDKGKRFKVPIYKKRAHSKSMQLLNRLRDYETEFLRFVFEKNVPPTNNQAERDLRMAKLKEKISGCFRSATTAKHFLIIKSFLSTLRKQNLDLIPTLQYQLA
jgi:transposase